MPGATAKADISELEQASVVGRRIANQSFIDQLNHRYGSHLNHRPAYTPRMADTVTADRARRHAEIDQLRRNRSVSALDTDYRAQLNAIVGELWQPERQRSATQTQANRPASAAGVPAARLRRLVANGSSRGAARGPSAQRLEESGAREEGASRPDEGAVDAVVRRLIDNERQREIRMLEERRSVAALLNSAFRADLEQLIQVRPEATEPAPRCSMTTLCLHSCPHLEPEAKARSTSPSLSRCTLHSEHAAHCTHTARTLHAHCTHTARAGALRACSARSLYRPAPGRLERRHPAHDCRYGLGRDSGRAAAAALQRL